MHCANIAQFNDMDRSTIRLTLAAEGFGDERSENYVTGHWQVVL